MSEEEKNRMQKVIIARFILSRLLMLSANVQITSLNFATGEGTVKFDVNQSDTALLAALSGGAG
jgi:hypothetical protein